MTLRDRLRQWLGVQDSSILYSLLEQRIRSVEIALTRVPEPEKKKSYAEINAEIMAKLEQEGLTPEEIADWRAGM